MSAERSTEGTSPTWAEHNPPPWFKRALAEVVIAIAGFFALRAVLSSLADFLILLLVALFLSFAIEPAVDWLEDRGWRRGRATGVVFVIIAALSSVLIFVMVNLVVQQVRTLVEDAPRLIRDATEAINDRFDAKITTDSIIERLEEYQGDLASTAGDVGGRVLSITGSALGIVFESFTVALFSFYLVADGRRLRRTICSVLPPERQRLVLGLWELAIRKTGGYLYSRLLLATISALVSWVALSVIGVPSPLALALWLGIVSQFVPVIGTYIGGALPLLIALLNEPKSALFVLVFLAVYQQLENYLLAPRITAKTMAIHPAVAFGAAIAGGSVIGPVGALLALPAAAIIQAFVSSYLQRHEVVSSGLIEPTDPAADEPEEPSDRAAEEPGLLSAEPAPPSS